MSREERRAYQRQMKGMDKGPQLPPAAKERAERNAARKAQRKSKEPTKSSGAFTTRFWVRSLTIAAVIGFLGFSLQWGEGMPRALYVGLAVTAVVLAAAVGFRFLQRRLPVARP